MLPFLDVSWHQFCLLPSLKTPCSRLGQAKLVFFWVVIPRWRNSSRELESGPQVPVACYFDIVSPSLFCLILSLLDLDSAFKFLILFLVVLCWSTVTNCFPFCSLGFSGGLGFPSLGPPGRCFGKTHFYRCFGPPLAAEG